MVFIEPVFEPEFNLENKNSYIRLGGGLDLIVCN